MRPLLPTPTVSKVAAQRLPNFPRPLGSIHHQRRKQKPHPKHYTLLSKYMFNGDAKSLTRSAWSELRLSPPRRMSFSHSGGEAKLSSFVDSKTIDSSSSELVIKGPGRVTIAAQTTHTLGSLPACATVSVSLHITAVGIASPSAVQISLLAAKPDKDMIAKWTFQSATP